MWVRGLFSSWCSGKCWCCFCLSFVRGLPRVPSKQSEHFRNDVTAVFRQPVWERVTQNRRLFRVRLLQLTFLQRPSQSALLLSSSLKEGLDHTAGPSFQFEHEIEAVHVLLFILPSIHPCSRVSNEHSNQHYQD